MTAPLWSGVFVAFLTTAASMIAFINSIVAGAGVTLLANSVWGGDRVGVAISLGAATTVALMAGFLAYQRSRYRSAESTVPVEELKPPSNAGRI